MAPRKKSSITAAEDIGNDLQTLRTDVTRLAEQFGEALSTTSHEALGDMKVQIRRIKENVDSIVSDASDRGREAKDAVREVAENSVETLEESLRSRPLTTLGMAIALGFLIGTIWRR
jgi:ElaB/YqjD/DUF883 family membrane-anchored ribosome-binding protein